MVVQHKVLSMVRHTMSDSNGSLIERLAAAAKGSEVLYGGRANTVEVTEAYAVFSTDGIDEARLTVETNRGATRRLEIGQKGGAYSDEYLAEKQYREGGITERGEWEVREYHGLDEFEIAELGDGVDRTAEEEKLLAYEPGDEIEIEHEEIEVAGTVDKIELTNGEVKAWIDHDSTSGHEASSYHFEAHGTDSYERKYDDEATELTEIPSHMRDTRHTDEREVLRFTDAEIDSTEEVRSDGGRTVGCLCCGFGYDGEDHDECPVCSSGECLHCEADGEAEEDPEILTDGGEDPEECRNGEPGCAGQIGLVDGELSCFECWLGATEEAIEAYEEADSDGEAEEEPELVADGGQPIEAHPDDEGVEILSTEADGSAEEEIIEAGDDGEIITDGGRCVVEILRDLSEGDRVRLASEAATFEAVVDDRDRYSCPDTAFKCLTLHFRPADSASVLEFAEGSADGYKATVISTGDSWEFRYLKAEVYRREELTYEDVDLTSVELVDDEEDSEVATDGGREVWYIGGCDECGVRFQFSAEAAVDISRVDTDPDVDDKEDLFPVAATIECIGAGCGREWRS